MSVKPSTRNILKVYRNASADQVHAGMVWYASAQLLAAELDPQDPARAAGVIAVLSPRKEWSENVKLARAAYAGTLGTAGSGKPHRTMSDHVSKAYRLIAGEDPNTVVQGPKVRAFWLSICDPSNPESVAVDRHALAVAAGRVLTDAERAPFAKGKGYASVADMYVRAACIASRESGQDINPCAMQAITWVAWIAEHQYARR